MLTGCCYSQSDNLVCPPLSFTPDLRPISDTAIQFQRTFSLFFVILLVFQSSVPLSGNSSTSYSRHYITASYSS